MESLCEAVGARGAALLQSDERSIDIPRTSGVDEAFTKYFTEGWHLRDVRAERGVPLLLRGESVVIDQDIVTPSDVDRHPFYADWMTSIGLRWFAVIGFRAEAALWGLLDSAVATGRSF